MSTENNKITIKYKDKKYEIEKKKDEQKVKPKGGKDTDEEITVKNYEEGKWNHTCECNGEKISVKWGKGKHITIWGSLSVCLVLGIVGAWLFLRKKKDDSKEEGL
jgi:hypothetical protein